MKRTGYGMYITEYIKNKQPGTPIYTDNTVKEVASYFGVTHEEAKKVVNVNLKRLTDKKKLERYQRGVYFIPKITAFGSSLLNPMQVFLETYIRNSYGEIGYETGPSLMNALGLTTQVPRYKYFTSNRCHKYGDNIDEKLKTVLRKPKTLINKENKPYMQLLDILENKDQISFDEEDARTIINNFIERNELDFKKLVGYAKNFYSKEVVWQLVEIAA